MTALTVHRAHDGTVRVETWEPVIDITAALLADVDPQLMRVTVQIRAENGVAEYEVTGWDYTHQALQCRLVNVRP